MADNLRNVGKGDRIKVSLQKHEVRRLAEKYNISTQAASGAISAAGPSRKKVEDYVKAKKKNGDYA